MKRPRFVPGNRVTLLRNGAEFFPALEAAIRGARREVHLQTYIFRADATGRRIADALQDAARRGVAVHLLVDGFGSAKLPRQWVDEMGSAGVRVLFFRPEISRWRLRRSRLRRMHRKVAVADDRVAFIGGINIHDDFDPRGPPAPRHDYAVSVEGPLIKPIHEMARRLWARVAWAHLQRRWARGLWRPAAPAPCGSQRAALLMRDNLRHRHRIEKAYLAAITRAEREVIVANAYFLPGLRFRHALMDAARRGVRVMLLLQGRPEYRLQHYATRCLYGQLLDAGVEIHEYHESFLHAKVAVVDGRWATVGSSNIDPFSLLLAREANVVVDDAEFAAGLRGSLLDAMERGGVKIERQRWKDEPLGARIAAWVSYGVVRLLMGFTGYDWNEKFPE
jgi:cardiolipin synthase A/B